MWSTCTCTLQAYSDLLPWYNICIVLQIVNVDISLLFLTIFIRYNWNWQIVDAIYTCTFSSLFIDRIFTKCINFMGILFHLLSNELWKRWTCNLEAGVDGSNPTGDKIFCNFHLFRVPRSLTGSVQMKSSMTFIRGNRCIERERKII